VSERRSWSEKRADIMSAPGAGIAYEAARVRFELRPDLVTAAAQLRRSAVLNWSGSAVLRASGEGDLDQVVSEPMNQP
jgi:hypothetical protein